MPLSPLRSALSVDVVRVRDHRGVGHGAARSPTPARLASPVFYVKMLFVALALVNLQLIKRSVFSRHDIDDRPLPPTPRLLAVTSLALWIAATTAGRLMAYLGPVGGLD